MIWIAIVAAVILFTVGLVVLGHTARRSERELSLLALVATLLTLILATAQNQQAAHDAAESAKAADRSAAAAAQSLVIEQAPALVINCEGGAQGKENAVAMLSPNARYFMTIEQPLPHEPLYDYETCIIRNFGRQPAIVATLPLTYQFYRVISPGRPVTLGTKTQFISVSGIAAQSSYTLWIENKSVRLNANVITPQSISFYEPSIPRRQLKYVFPRSVKYTVTILNPAHLPTGTLNEPFLRNMQ